MNLRKIIATGLCAACFTSGPLAASAQEFVMKVSAPVPGSPKVPVFAWMLAFEKGVEERSEGRIDVQLYPSNLLGQLPAAIEGVSMGTIEATFSIVGFFSSINPRFQVLDAGGLFETPEQAMRAFGQPEVEAMLNEFGANAGVKPLVILVEGQGLIVSKEPLETVADFDGKKIRTGGATPLLNKPMEAVGAAPVALPLGEVVPSLQTGTIDGATNSMVVVNGLKMADVAANVTYVPGNYTTVGAVINEAFLEKIGDDLSQIIFEEADKAREIFFENLKQVAAMEKVWEGMGGRVIRMNDEETAKYLDITNAAITDTVSADPQMTADYDVLNKAADAVK